MGSLRIALIHGEARDRTAQVRAARAVVAVDIAAKLLSSHRRGVMGAQNTPLRLAHAAPHLPLPPDARLVQHGEPVIEDRDVLQRRPLRPMPAALLGIPDGIVVEAAARALAEMQVPDRLVVILELSEGYLLVERSGVDR